MALDDLREQLIADFGKKSLPERLLGILPRVFSERLRAPTPSTGPARSNKEWQGLYLWGAPGGGKSMLMELFYRSLESTPRLDRLTRQRIHFLTFMEGMHAAIAELNRSKVRNPMARLARRVATQSRLLCFDEFIVEDIVDAMLLGRLFEALLQHGVVLVATSNFALRELYKGGLKRDNFLPFLKIIAARVQSLALHAVCDYRSMNLKKATIKTSPKTPLAKGEQRKHYDASTPDGANREKRGSLFSDLWFSHSQGGERIRAMFALSIRGGSLEENKIVLCEGRELVLEQYGKISKKEPNKKQANKKLQRENVYNSSVRHGVGLSSFAKICQLPRGVRDYRALLACCDLLFLTEIPELSEKHRNETKRFMRLIDLFYEEDALVLCATKATTPRLLYSGLSHAQEFPRTASRLEEMITRANNLI